MELKIRITKENKNKVFKLIEGLLDEESVVIESQPSIVKSSKDNDVLQLLSQPQGLDNLSFGNIFKYKEDIRPQTVGFWAQTNSVFSIMASLRILANLMRNSNSISINLQEFVNICKKVFNFGYGKYRGFPSSDKESAIGRFVWHFLTPAFEMGLISIKESKSNQEGIPWQNKEWKKVQIAITKQGYQLAKIHSKFFDEKGEEQILNDEERVWWLNYLKEIDSKGFKEYNLMRDVYNFLRKGHNGKDELFNWFENDERFVNYIKSWSRKAKSGDDETFNKQLNNLAMSFAGSKVALLREFGLIKNKRNDYSIVGVFL